jgi:hypothetical protein
MKLLSTPLYSFISSNHLIRNRNLFFQFLKTFVFVSFIFLGNINAQTVIYVDSSKASSGVGTSWSTAYKTLKEATIFSNNNTVVKEIRIAKGTYFPTTNTNRDSTFLISRGDIRLFGGYPSGGGTRNIVTNPTILSGDIGTLGTQTDNSYHVMVIAGLDAGADSVIIEGLNIRWGRAGSSSSNVIYNGVNISRENGGGLSIISNANDYKIFIINCIISGNWAGNAGAGALIENTLAKFINCLFSGNYADYGGAVFNSSNTHYGNCTFGGNYDNHGGAGMRNSGSNPIIYNCIIYGNNGGISNNNSSPIISNSLVQGLTTTIYGNLNGGTNDPLFVAPVSPGTVNVGGNYRIQSVSPCIDYGGSPNIPIGFDTELGGNPRYFCKIDMGAYEYSFMNIRYVKDVPSGIADGSSWANASNDFQLMINQSRTCSEIWVAKGTYIPIRPADNLNTIDSNNRANAFVLRANVKIYGGFPATGNPSMAQRNWNTNTTKLSGDIGIKNDLSDNCYHVLIASYVGSNAVLDGFNIEGGNANLFSSIYVNERTINHQNGGGMYNDNYSFPTLSNTTFSGNNAISAGGGIYNFYNSSPNVMNSIFSGNSANNGGGMYNDNYSAPTLSNTTFSGNKANNGGALYNKYLSYPKVNNSIFYGNSSEVYSDGNSSATIKYSIVKGGFTGTGNMNINPLFVNAPSYNTAPFTGGDYRLQICSPAINVGNNAALPFGITEDILGNPRISEAIVDMGAYEYQLQMRSIITTQPINDTACVGGTSSFSVLAANTTSYQWQVNTGSGFNNISNNTFYTGVATATLNISNAILSMNGNVYRVITSGICQLKDTSELASLLIANIRYVKQVGVGDESGTSWANASGDLQLMINLSCPNSEIWVAQGTYLSNGTGFTLKNDVKIFGGFSNSGNPVFVNRNPSLYLSILSGENVRRVFNNNFSSSNPLTNSAILDGFTITEGNFGNGAGMYNANASPTLKNLIFKNNNSTGNGGAIYNAASNPLITNCKFIGNSSSNNGGAVCNASISLPKIVNSLFVSNTATNGGGAIYANNASSYELINSTIYNNTANVGGGLNHAGSTTHPSVKNSIIYGNGQQVINSSSATTAIEYSLVEGGYNGTGNLDEDPLFINSASNYSLQSCSPAINTGNNTTIPTGITTDIIGSPRIYDTTVDMGCYEYQFELPLDPIITSNPSISISCAGSGASFSIIASNVSTYQWQENSSSGFINLSNSAQYLGVETSTLNISNSLTTMNGYQYRCIVKGGCSTDSSELASLNIINNIWYVKQNESGNGSGDSWFNASNDLQKIINQACPNSEIWVAKGTYYPIRPADNLNTIDSNNRDNSFVLKADVKIFGGFPKIGSPGMAQRDWNTNITTLSGDIGIVNDSTDNCYHVVISSGAIGAAELNGFFITKGNSDGENYIIVNGSSVQRNYGGGMHRLSSSAAVNNITFTENNALYGGGMYNLYSSATISNSIFSKNKSELGGGMFNVNNSSPIINQCIFSDNTASEGAGMYSSSSSPNVSNSIFSSNKSSNAGGGMSNRYSSSTIITNCIFNGNTATRDGGGVYNFYSFVNMANSVFSGNTANSGGVMSNSNSSPEVINSTFSGNKANSGGVMYNSVSSPLIKNSIIYGNSSLFFNDASTPIINYSIIQGGYIGTENLDIDPLFASAPSYNTAPFAGGDYSLQPCSPAINVGNNTDIPIGITTDIEGNSRIYETTVDMGAYEYQLLKPLSPLIIIQPSNTTVCLGIVASFSITATKTNTFQWQEDTGSGFNNLINTGSYSGVKTASLNISNTTLMMGGHRYRCIAIGCPNDTSDIATLDIGNIRYVKQGGTGNQSGLNWANASGDLQLTINQACPNSEIWVAQGTYYPNRPANNLNNININNRDNAFVLKADVKIYGGFPAIGTPTFEERDWNINITTLSGDIGIANNTSDNSYHVVISSGPVGSAELNGFIVTKGNANISKTIPVNGYNPNGRYGGGMYNDNSSPTIANSTFSENKATNGSGIYNTASSPTISNSTFSQNQATNNGGGMYNSSSSIPMISNSIFSRNTANSGGGMYNSSDPIVSKSVFSRNTAQFGGGMYNDNTIPKISSCSFSGNTASEDGGGMYNNYALPEISNSIFSGNNATYGGGMSNSSSSFSAINSVFSGNKSTFYGGIMYNYNSSPVLNNCILYGNSSGIYGNSVITYSVVQDGNIGTGNLVANPLFENAPSHTTAPFTGGDYRLQACSPAINAGNNAVIPPGVTTDIAENPRIYETIVDMGAYEYQSPKQFSPIITTEPINTTVCVGSFAFFTITATNATTYQWQVNTGSGFENISNNSIYSGATTATLNISNSTAIMNGYRYRVIASGNCQTDTSVEAILAIANVRYVRQGGSGNQTGTSWANASGDLQMMINQACPNSEIWVAKGTYKPNRPADNLSTIDINNRKNAFVLKADVKILGGFPATGNPTIAQRNWNTNIIILSGDIGIVNNVSDNSYHVVISSGDVGSAELNGFTITKGNASEEETIVVNNNNLLIGFGGGMYNSSSLPRIYNCIFSGNIANNGGGGMHNSSSSPKISNSIFSGNKADFGGGMNNDNSSPLISNSTFSGNFSTQFGGGMHNTFSSPTITNSIFYGNSLESLNNVNASFSIIQGGYAGIGNLDIDPLFVNAPSYTTAPFTGGNYRLQPCSPAINVGNNTLIASEIITDIEGNPRIYESTVDMGAYEFNPVNSEFIITTEPKNTIACLGSASFNIIASNVVSYFWQVNTGSGFFYISNNTTYSGSTTSGLNINNVTSSMNGYTYRVIINGNCQLVDTSKIAMLSVTNIRYVRQDGSGNQSGSSWENASGDLQLTINQACPNSEIWVAQGTYKPNRPANNLNTIATNNRDNAFVLKANVKIFGGFLATGNPEISDRDWNANITTLSGDIGTVNNVSDNCYHVVISSGLVGTAELNGFTITKGNANTNRAITVNGYSPDARYGGGMYNDNSSPTISNITFSENNATNGGGIYNAVSSPTISNSVFSENTATINGGGINNSSSSPTISNTTFSGNTANSIGGGIYNYTSSPTMNNCTIVSNNANSNGGGISNINISYPIISNCTITLNFATNNGGGMHNDYSSPTVSKSSISGNTASNGGGIYNYNTSIDMYNTSVSGNIANTSGGGMYNTASYPRLINSIIKENNSNSGGGVYNLNSFPTLTNVTISGNTANSGAEWFNQSGFPTIYNSIIWGNGIYGDFNDNQNSLIQGRDSTNDGNISGIFDPLFMNPSGGDYSLQPCSPAINAGRNGSFCYQCTDIAGNPRIQESTVDMGAYENLGYSLQELANSNLTAEGNCNSSDGWQHYYTKVQQQNKIVVSINSHGQDLGAISAASILTDDYDLMSNQIFQPYGQEKTYYPFNRSWSVESPNTFNQPVSVRFYFSESDSSDIATSIPFGSLQNLTLYKVNGTDVWNIGATNYKEYTFGQVADTSHFTLGTFKGIKYAEFQVNSFSTGTMAMTLDESVLPLDLISFTASAIYDKTQFQWRTVNEVNVSHFEIERSVDGIHWEIIQTSSATNGIEQNYTAWDLSPNAGTIYYRLKMIDIDGSYKYSKIVEVHFSGLNKNESQTKFIVYPNPNNGSFIVNAKGMKTSSAQIQLYDGLGRVVYSNQIQEGNNSINLRQLVAGIYYLNINSSSSGISVQKIIIE